VSSSRQARRKEGVVPEQNGERDERNGVQVECFLFSVVVFYDPFEIGVDSIVLNHD